MVDKLCSIGGNAINKLRSIGEENLKDAIYAANDGAVTTFAIVAAVAGATLESSVILILGFSNMFADAFSMATGNYLGTRSESDQYDHEREKKEKELEQNMQQVIQEEIDYFVSVGYSRDDAEQMTNAMVKKKDFFLDILMYKHLGIDSSGLAEALKGANVTFFAFIVAGIIPLLPYLVFSGNDVSTNFLIVCILTGITMFFIGSLRTIYSAKNWFAGGIEMLLVGGLAAAISYGIGFLVDKII